MKDATVVGHTSFNALDQLFPPVKNPTQVDAPKVVQQLAIIPSPAHIEKKLKEDAYPKINKIITETIIPELHEMCKKGNTSWQFYYDKFKLNELELKLLRDALESASWYVEIKCTNTVTDYMIISKGKSNELTH